MLVLWLLHQLKKKGTARTNMFPGAKSGRATRVSLAAAKREGEKNGRDDSICRYW